MTAVSAVSDGSPDEHPSRIIPARTISARHLARNTAAILRAVADHDHTFAIEHFGRVIGFLVPREGRVLARLLVRKGGMYHVTGEGRRHAEALRS